MDPRGQRGGGGQPVQAEDRVLDDRAEGLREGFGGDPGLGPPAFAFDDAGEDTVFLRADAPRVDACAVRYSAPDADGGVPRIAVRTDGC